MEKLLFKKVELWLVILILLVCVVATIIFGWVVKYTVVGGKKAGAIGEAAVVLASIPSNLKILYDKGLEIEGGKIVQKNPQILDFKNAGNFLQIDNGFHDDGLLFISAYSKEHSVSTVYLYDIINDRKIWEWIPSPEDIVEASPSLKAAKKNGKLEQINTRALFRSQHPLLLDDGSIILSGGEGPLIRMSPCGKLMWVTDRQFHHSIEEVGDSLIVPIVSQVNRDNYIGKYLRDDGYAIVAKKDGRIIKEESIASILMRGGYEGLLFGQSMLDFRVILEQKGFEDLLSDEDIKEDRVHLNDAEVILHSDNYVKSGDVMFSIRNLSTVFLYRPSEDRIVWLKTGPWLGQHDIDYLGNGKFSIFGNDAYAFGKDIPSKANSTIYVYDMQDGSISKPYETTISDSKLTSATQGQQRILSNGDAFIEITASGKLFRISPKKIRWSYVHRISNLEIGALHWSRYFNRNEVNLDWIKNSKCD